MTIRDGLRQLLKACDLITYEFENISADALSFLEEKYLLRPSRSALEKSQDRLIEKQFLRELDIATSPFDNIETLTISDRCSQPD